MDTTAPHRPSPVWSWLLLLKTPAIAARGRVMLIVVSALLLVAAGDAMLSDGVSPTAPPDLAWNNLARATVASVTDAYRGLIEPFVQIVQGEATRRNVLRALWRLAVWGLVGGAIVRIAVLYLTRNETPDIAAALRYAWQRKSGFFGGPLLLLTGWLVVIAPLAIVRGAMQLSWLQPVAAARWPVVIVCAIVATIYTVASLLGWPMLWAATAADDSDAFDSVSRMFAYVYQKPLRLLGYLLVLAGVGGLAAFAAQAFAMGVLQACQFAAGETNAAWATATIAWWQSAATLLVVAYSTAYSWAAAAGVYLLRRQDIDGVHVDEVFIAADEYSGGLPRLGEDATGVPAVEKSVAEAA